MNDKFQRELLGELKNSKRFTGEDAPLKNVLDNMGELRAVEGNPLFRAEITINVTVQYFDGAWNPLAPAALPANEQTDLPFYLFGLTDFYGGYPTCRLLYAPPAPWIPNQYVINGHMGIVFPAVVQTVPGDMVFAYDDPATANMALIVIHCTNVAYGTFLNSFVSDLIKVNQIRYIVPVANIFQLANTLTFGYQTLFGRLKTDSVDPRMYQVPTDFQNQISDIPLAFPIDKNLFIANNITFGCQFMTFVFFVSKIEPLTLRKLYQ